MSDLSSCEPITSVAHPELRSVLSLRSRAGRYSAGRAYVEGIRFVSRAATAGAVRLCLVDPSASRGHARFLAERLRQSGVRAISVSPGVLAELGFGADNQGIGAVIRAETVQAPLRPARDRETWLALRQLQSAGNFGTIVRTADAAGIRGIFLVGPDIDPFDPRAVRASMGSMASVPFHRATLEQLVRWSRQVGASVVGASPSARIDLAEMDCQKAAVVFLGAEREGLLPAELVACDQLVRIPMRPGVDSLNVAVAAGLFIYRSVLVSRPTAHPRTRR